MSVVNVNLDGVGAGWIRPCQQAVTHLNALFKRNNIKVMLATSGAGADHHRQDRPQYPRHGGARPDHFHIHELGKSVVRRGSSAGQGYHQHAARCT